MEAGLLQVEEGLLLRARRQAAGRRDQRLRLQVRPRVLHRGLRLPRRRRRQLRDRPGRHDRHAAPARPRVRRALQRRHALRAPRRARRSSAPTGTVLRRITPEGRRHGRRARSESSTTSTARCRASPRSARWPGRWAASRSTRCTSASKTGSAEVYGKQSTVVGRVLRRGLRRGDDESARPAPAPARPAPAVRKIWEALYGIDGKDVNPRDAAIPGTHAARRAAAVPRQDGSILPPAREGGLMATVRTGRTARPARPRHCAHPASTGC